MIEIWKDIPTLEGRYQVSSYGRIRSLRVDGSIGKMRSLSKTRDGYLHFCYVSNGKRNMMRVHRAVAMAFLPNPNNYPCVNHRDEDKTNNYCDNLEWCSVKYNSNYGTRNHRLSAILGGLNLKRKTAKAICQIDKTTGMVISTYRSIDDAVIALGLSTRSHVSECYAGKRKSAHGYYWKYANNSIKTTKY